MWRTSKANRNVFVSMLFFNIVIFLCSCVGGFLFDVPNSPLLRPVGTQTSHRTLSKSVHCSNITPYCASLGRSVCTLHVTWAKYNCQLLCGFCPDQNSTTPVTTMSTTSASGKQTSFQVTSTLPLSTSPPTTTADSMTCEDIFRKASVLDFSQTNAEINNACRLNLQHIGPHILAPYLDILRTTSLVACFYSLYDVRHHDEYFNQESHVIAICKPGAMCFNEGHGEAYKRGCVAGHTNQHQSTCSTDFCNNRTQTEMDLIENILSLITTTTIKTTTTSTTTSFLTTTSVNTQPMAGTNNNCLDELNNCAMFKSMGVCHASPQEGTKYDIAFQCKLTCDRCNETYQPLTTVASTIAATIRTTKATTPVPTTANTTAMITTTHQTSGKPCPSCDTDMNCVWNQTCADSETCMVRGVVEHDFQFTVHCILTSDCRLMTKYIKSGEIYCCDDRSCLQNILGITTIYRAASTTTQKVSTTTASSPSVGSTADTTNTRLMCPECDADLNCEWNRACYPGQVCMIRSFNSTTVIHCSEKENCNFMKATVHHLEILCCEDHQCITDIIP